ncbi:putative PEP-binding protein, partial [Rhizobium ruizarguesonis]
HMGAKGRTRQLDHRADEIIDLHAHVIAEVAEFFSFGTNDLTQTTFGISRDDASAFIPNYQRKGIIEHDPFISLNFDGVGEL